MFEFIKKAFVKDYSQVTFETLTPEFREELRNNIIDTSDTGCDRVILKNMVIEDYPGLDKRIIYRLIKEMVAAGDLFYEGKNFIKSPIFYPNTAIKEYERKKQPVPQHIVDIWERKNKRKYSGNVKEVSTK